jgi:hypothetical protein
MCKGEKGFMKKKLIGFLFVFFLSGIFFLKDALVTKAVELYVRKSLQEASFWKAESVQREEEQLVLQKGVVQTPYGIATFEELRLSVHLSLLPFSFEPSIELSGLCLQLDTGAKGSSLRAPSLWIPPSFF